ncbi:MAG TPA: serine/threonine-protein kinase [Marinobacter sp.]|nr:serine/threonine-protein kinase [Marinobacter sp.]
MRYDIAIQQERKRQYDQAVSIYRNILAARRNFRDVAARLTALEKVTGDAGTLQPSAFDNSRTLLMPEQSLSRPALGRYEIEREIGRGAMGVVYLGKDPTIARTVAIKTLSYQAFDANQVQELKERFFREAKAAGRLSHPAIVTVYDVGEEADLAYIAMDYAQGRPLSDFGKPGRLLPLSQVLDVVARVAEALAYAHSQNIIHRDIKPGNIIYNPDNGSVKITDFGIAKITDDSRTRTGSVMGSPLYMSPEQLKGQKVTGASDIYSLGITLYKLVTGETPFQGDSLANLTYQILNKRPRSAREFNADLPAGVVRLINKAIQRDPDKRFVSAATMADAVRKLALREEREVS